MATLNPTIDTGIHVESPVVSSSGAGLSAIGALASLLPTGRPAQPTQAQRDNASLKPFARAVSELKTISDPAVKRRRVSEVTTQFLVENPGLENEAVGLVGTILGIEATPQKTFEQIAMEAEEAATSEFLSSPAGQLSTARNWATRPDGSPDAEAIYEGVRKDMLEEEASIQENDRIARHLENTQNNREQYLTESSNVLDTKTASWTTYTQETVSGIIASAAQGAENLGTTEQQMSYLRETRRLLTERYRSDALDAGVAPELIEDRLVQALAPIDNMIATVSDSLGDPGAILKAAEAAGSLQLSRELGTILGAKAFDPDYRRTVLETHVNSNGLPAEGIRLLHSDSTSGLNLAPLNVLPGLSASVNGPRATEEELVNPEITDYYRENTDQILPTIKDNSAIISGTDTSTVADPSVQNVIFTNLGKIVAASSAHQGPVGQDVLKDIMSPSSIRVLSTAVRTNTSTGEDIKAALYDWSSIQIQRNMRVLQSFEGELASQGFSVQLDTNGGLVLTAPPGAVVEGGTIYWENAQQAIQNINFINSSLGRITGDPQEVKMALGDFTADITGTKEFLEGSTIEIPESVLNDAGFMNAVSVLGAELGANPMDLMRVMFFETGGTFDPAVPNAGGSGATGLIQFMPQTAKALGTTTDALAAMSRTEQMVYVGQYLKNILGGVENPTLGDLYTATLWPIGVGKPPEYVFFSKGSAAYDQNSGFDTNGDGKVTKGEVDGFISQRTGGNLNVTIPDLPPSYIPTGGTKPTAKETREFVNTAQREIERRYSMDQGAANLPESVRGNLDGTPSTSGVGSQASQSASQAVTGSLQERAAAILQGQGLSKEEIDELLNRKENN